MQGSPSPEPKARPTCAFSGAMAVARVGARRTKPQLVERVGQAAGELGADQSYFVSFMHERERFDSYRFLLACDPAWCLEYERKNCHLHDPWLYHAKRNGRPIRGRDIPLREEERPTVELAARYGFVSTLIVPTPAAEVPSKGGVLVLGSGSALFLEDETFSAVKVLARSLALEINDRLTDLLREERLAVCRLSTLDVDLLLWEREGLTTKAIARRSGLSHEAIDCRFRRLNAKLGAASRTDAARIAAQYGLL